MLRKLIAFIALAAAPMLASAHMLIAPCDFLTGGGFIFTDDGSMVNFAIQGGCKNDKWWGGINLVDHNTGMHFKSRDITGYMMDPSDPNAREICGTGTIDDGTVVYFRARVVDNGEPGTNDLFGIGFDNRTTSGNRFTYITARQLSGGNIQLHSSNNSTTADPGFFSLEEWQMCGDLNSPQ